MDIQKINSYIKTNNLTQLDEEDKQAVLTLLDTQHNMCSNILKELESHGKKTSCWAWYIFPNKKAGDNDHLKTRVTIDTANILLEFAPSGWRFCLETIIDLAIDKNNKLNKVLFDVDIDRVGFFVDFWKNIPNKPEWLKNVCEDFENILHGITPIQRIRPNKNTRYLLTLLQKHFYKLNNIINI
jgi:hypothetical protein